MDFAKGIYYKQPADNAPKSIIGKIAIKKDEFMDFLDGFDDEWVRLEVRMGKNDKPFIAIDDFVPDPSKRKSVKSKPAKHTTTSDDGEVF